jgi:hypothetical protein
MAWARKSTTGNQLRSGKSMREKTYNTKQDPEADFSFKLKQNPYNYGGHRPPSLIWLETKNGFLAHFYSRNAKWNWKVSRSPINSRVLYIGPSKRLNDYYAPRA